MEKIKKLRQDLQDWPQLNGRPNESEKGFIGQKFNGVNSLIEPRPKDPVK